MRTWSAHQKAIFRAISRTNYNILVDAGAGAGKTTTITEAATRLPEELDIASIAFNNHIVKELKTKMPPHVKVSTMHSFGWQCLRLHYGNRIFVDKDKTYKVVNKLMMRWKIPSTQQKGYAFRLNKVVDLMRMNLLDVASKDSIYDIIELGAHHDLAMNETEAEHAIAVLARMNKDTESFDFTDMIYHTVLNTKIRIPKFDVVFVDEAQDLNRAQQTLMFRMIKKKGRFVCVGDPAQAIYGFAGADSDSFNLLANQDNTVTLPLSVCYRCGQRIVRWAQRIVPGLLPNPDGHEGRVRKGSIQEVVQGDWILCRNTKPLVSLCLALIRQHRKATIKGRDYGNELIHLLRKCNTKNMVVASVKLEAELRKLERKLTKWGVLNPSASPSYVNLLEKVEILREIVFEEVDTIDAGIKLIQSIFSDDIASIVLSTIHKSKGFENDRVFVLHPDLLPSKYAVQDWQLQQEQNLEYVMITRAKNELIYLTDVSK
jgi:DNA helicase-2/ATP-dependent DNA helicase PcrA